MDISKAFDCVNDGFLMVKLSAYGLNKDALQLIRNYLSNRQQTVKINNSFSDVKERNQDWSTPTVGPRAFIV